MNNNTFVESVSNDAELIKFSEFYALCVYYHTMKHLHNIDVWANGDAHKVYASQYSKAILYHYGYDDDEYLVDTSFEKDFSNVVKQLVHDPYDLWVIAHMTSKLVNDYRDELNEALWYNPYKAQLTENYTKYVPVPSSNSQYVIACDVEVVEPVRDDVKLPLPVEVIELPQEVVSEPQEDCLSTTTLNEDTVMNTSTFIPSWEVSGYVSLLDLDFGTYVVVEPEPIVELTGQASDFACHISDGWTGQCTELTCDVLSGQCSDVLEGWIGKASELTCHISDGWYGQCCDLADAPKPIESKSEQLAEVEARVAKACAKMAHRSAYASPVRCGSPVNTTPTTTDSEVVQVSSTVEPEVAPDKPVTVSDKQFAELTRLWEQLCPNTYVSTPLVDWQDKTYSRPIASATGRDYQYSTQVKEFKSTLFNVDEYDITRNVVVDVATTTPATPKATVAPKAPATPKPSTAKFASNFNSLVMAKYRELNGGIIKDSLVLNKLTSALRANNSEAYTALVTTFGNATAVALHRQAYDAVVSAS